MSGTARPRPRARRAAVALAATVALLMAAPAAASVSHPYSTITGDVYTPYSGGNGLSFTGGTDDGWATVTLPFSFSYFGSAYALGTTLNVSTNGVVQFGGIPPTPAPYLNTGLPTTSFANPVILPYWDDFDVTSTGWNEGVWAGTSGTAPNRRMFIHWQGYRHNTSPAERLQFQLVLHEGTNRIDVVYLRSITDPMPNGSSATIGLQLGSEVVPFSYNTASIPQSGFYISWYPQRPAYTSLPIISGTAAIGQTLSTTNGTWVGDPHLYEYQWGRCDDSPCTAGATPITGANASTYIVTAADTGKYLVAMVTASNGWGAASEDAWSARVGPVPSLAPVSLTAPGISGTPRVGETVALTDGTWSGSPSSYEYRWYRCLPSGGGGCTPAQIAGAAAKTYVLTIGEIGHTVFGQVRAANAYGWSAWRSSASVGPVEAVVVPVPESTSPPSVSGDATEGATATLDRGGWNNSPDGYEQQWIRCVPVSGGCMPSDIPGATGLIYVLTTDDVGSTVYARVRAHNAGGWSAWRTSYAIGPVRSGQTQVPPDYGDETGAYDDGEGGDVPDGKGDVEPSGESVRLAVLGLDVVPARFRAARRGPSTSPARGTRVSFRLVRPGPVVFRVERAARGRAVGGRCVVPTRRNRARRPCTRWSLVLGSFTWTPPGSARAYSFRFTGRIGGRSLKPGRYRLVAVATTEDGAKSVPARHAFRIVR